MLARHRVLGGADPRCVHHRCSARATSTPPSTTRAWWRRSPSSRWSSCWRSSPVGVFVTFGMFDGFGDIFAAPARGPTLAPLLDAARGRARRLRELGLADDPVDARDHVPAAPVPGGGDRERRRAPPQQGDLAVSALHARDQHLRAADRLRRAACTFPTAAWTPTPSCSRCRWPRKQEGLALLVFHRRPVGGDRHGDRRDDRALDHGVQRPA